MNTQSPKTHTQRCTGTVGTKLTKPNSMINGQDCLRKQAGGNLIVPCDILLTAEAERGQLGEKFMMIPGAFCLTENREATD